MQEQNKKYNHALSISFSVETDSDVEAMLDFIGTTDGLSFVAGHCIKRLQQVLENKESEAFDIWDTYENF